MDKTLRQIQKLSDQDQYESAKEFLRCCYRKSLKKTAINLLGYKDINERTHGEMVEVLESLHHNKLIVMPRGTFKSSLCSVGYPIWSLIRDPNERILLDGELYTNSKNFLREISNHLESPRMTSLFGQFKTSECWNEGELIIRQRTRILKEASITASGIGSEKTGQHYDKIIMDDLNSPTNSSSEEGRQKVIDHFRYNISILEPGGTLVVVATRYAEFDLPGFILDNVAEISQESHSHDAGGLLKEEKEDDEVSTSKGSREDKSHDARVQTW